MAMIRMPRYVATSANDLAERGSPESRQKQPCVVCGRKVWNRYTGKPVACADCRSCDPWAVERLTS